MVKGLLERLRGGEVVVGDGGVIMALERRGYVKAGKWTTEAAVENPEAVQQLHREFVRAGSDVIQTFTFNSAENKLKLRNCQYSSQQINEAAMAIARGVADESDNVLVAGGISQSSAYSGGQGKEAVQNDVRKQLQAFIQANIDFVIVEYYMHVEEIEWAIEEVKKTGLPVVATMAIGAEGDHAGHTLGQCAVKMARAGADVVGLNCLFDPVMTLENIRAMKAALDAAGLTPFLMTQPNGYFTTGCGMMGYEGSPEYPLALESRTVSRWDVHKYARAAYELGVRYIGGCCGFEAYHVRAISEELAEERGRLPKASEKHEPWGAALLMSGQESIRKKASREYWENIVPITGRPTS